MTPTHSASSQALFFVIVGGAAALTHFVMLWLLVSQFAITPAWANVWAFLVAFVVSFLGHFYLTFRPQHTKTASKNIMLASLLKWFASSVAGFALNQGLFVLGLHLLGERYYLVVWFIVTALVTLMSFALGKLWAFKS